MYKPLTIPDNIKKMIKEYLHMEVTKGLNLRDAASKKLKRYLEKTADGSYTLPSDERMGNRETMHTLHGAITESYEKFVKPSKLEGKDNLKVLDICSGLGYNTTALIGHLECAMSVDMIEASPETIAATLLIPSPIKEHEIVKRVYEEWLIKEGLVRFQLIKAEIPDSLSFRVFCEDARKVLPSLTPKYYDAIFLDAFSPSIAPELYTLEFMKELYRIIKDDGVLTTYTSAAPVRAAMIKVGFHVGESPPFGRKRGGTIASPSKGKVGSLSMEDERMIALSDAGIPYRDHGLDDSPEKIIERRKNERMVLRNVKKISSTVRTPIYLGRRVEMDRMGRRILKNLERVGIPDTLSNKALYIICPQFEECICGCGLSRLSSSRDRILEMEKRLNTIIKGDSNV
ncbi:MAG: MnmC family methyltransferase [Methanothermobacter tenebrarum]|nr:MnmC family methyltransferase [Methanothermobacter sp.]HOQ19456.1 MnmC family methyltransferase [Methanothermobacter sp.]